MATVPRLQRYYQSAATCRVGHWRAHRYVEGFQPRPFGCGVGSQFHHRPRFQPWTLLTKVETSCDRILIAGGANVEAEWEQGPAV